MKSAIVTTLDVLKKTQFQQLINAYEIKLYTNKYRRFLSLLKFFGLQQAHTDKQTHRYTDTQTHIYTDTQAHRYTDTHTHRHTGIQTHRHTDTQTHTDIHTHIYKDSIKRHTWPVGMYTGASTC